MEQFESGKFRNGDGNGNGSESGEDNGGGMTRIKIKVEEVAKAMEKISKGKAPSIDGLTDHMFQDETYLLVNIGGKYY